MSDDARQAIVELDQDAAATKVADAERAAGKRQTAKNSSKTDLKNGRGSHSSPAESRGGESSEIPAGHLARVTGIRHWSTPDYTRVAIDVESDVKFVSRRIDSPARILFDLRDTKLASTLVGKTFDGDAGFLKKIRVAESAPGRTRVVLEVDNLSDYDAFLLPNPYRLVIDIHGRGT